jgi:hypothetical protein
MSLSKNGLLYEIASEYNACLRNSPLITKSITSGVIGFAGSLVASKLRVIIYVDAT